MTNITYNKDYRVYVVFKLHFHYSLFLKFLIVNDIS